MHNYTLQCFGQLAVITNDKGAGIWAGSLSTGSYVGPILIPNCIKSLNLEGMRVELLDGFYVKFSRGTFYCTLVGLTIDDEPGRLSDEGYMPGNLSYKDRESRKYFVYFDPPKPSEGAELLKLVPAKLRKGAKYHDDGKYVHSGGLTITKKQDHASVDYWGGVEPLKGLITPPDKSCTTVRIEFDGHNYAYEFDHAKLIEKLSKKATFGPYQSGIAAYLDGVSYFFRSMGTSNFTYITLSLNTTMEQVA